MLRRAVLAAMLPLAACAPAAPPDFRYRTAADPFAVALLTAEQNLSDMTRFAGDPAKRVSSSSSSPA
jgi:hypothetical protein